MPHLSPVWVGRGQGKDNGQILVNVVKERTLVQHGKSPYSRFSALVASAVMTVPSMLLIYQCVTNCCHKQLTYILIIPHVL